MLRKSREAEPVNPGVPVVFQPFLITTTITRLVDAENIHHSTMQLCKQVKHYRTEIITAHHFPPGIKCGIYHKAGPQSTVLQKTSSDSTGVKNEKNKSPSNNLI